MTEKTQSELLQEIQLLKAQKQDLEVRLEEAEETLRAITTGEVDALVVYGEDNERIYTLQGADYAYRVMVESIREGAANLTADGVILYCNKRLAEMLGTPLEKVLGSSFQSYLSEEERMSFTTLRTRGLENAARSEFTLAAGKRVLPVLITASAAEVDGQRGLSLVVTDLTEQKRAMARERELQNRLAGQREEERVRIARNLHDGPIQDLIGLSFTLEEISGSSEPQLVEDGISTLRQEIRKLIGELRTVCNELRPPNVIQFGLNKAIRSFGNDFGAKYPNLLLTLDMIDDANQLPVEVSTTLFRVYQESMRNIIRHANANAVDIRLQFDNGLVRLEIQDDGKGFLLPEDWVELARKGHLGLVGMKERVEAIGGRFCVISQKETGTTVRAEVPLNPPAPQEY